MNSNFNIDTSKTYYFSSPTEAIKQITRLLKKRNFKILAARARAEISEDHGRGGRWLRINARRSSRSRTSTR